MECSHDCFRCPFEDCIQPDDDLTALEIAQSEALDRDAERSCCEADFEGDPEKAAIVRKRMMRREWYVEHRSTELVKHAQYRAAHREEKKQQDSAYYLAHREEINQRKRERRALERARKLAEKQQKSKEER